MQKNAVIPRSKVNPSIAMGRFWQVAFLKPRNFYGLPEDVRADGTQDVFLIYWEPLDLPSRLFNNSL